MSDIYLSLQLGNGVLELRALLLFGVFIDLQLL